MGLIKFIQKHKENVEHKKIEQQKLATTKQQSKRYCPRCNKEITSNGACCPYCYYFFDYPFACRSNVNLETDFQICPQCKIKMELFKSYKTEINKCETFIFRCPRCSRELDYSKFY